MRVDDVFERVRIARRFPAVDALGANDVAAVERRDFQPVERADDHRAQVVETDVVDQEPQQVAHRHVAVVLRAELAEDRVGLIHVLFALEQFFVGRAHVAGAGRADRDHVVEAERFGLRVGARVEHARDVAIDVVDDRGAAARRRGEFDQFDAELLGQQHRRVEEFLARLFGDAAREEAVALAHSREWVSCANRVPALREEVW